MLSLSVFTALANPKLVVLFTVSEDWVPKKDSANFESNAFL